MSKTAVATSSIQVRVSGIVQGVGFRPMVWRLAKECRLAGDVQNDAAGVLIRLLGTAEAQKTFLARLKDEAPPLSRIDSIVIEKACLDLQGSGFHIRDSIPGETRTEVTPDAATCPRCIAEVLNPDERRARHPFANCTHCGPRFSIIKRVPYDRAATTMSVFPMCEDCSNEYGDPADRRFHAQPIACQVCGPRAWIERLEGNAAEPFNCPSSLDCIEAAAGLLRGGEIIAIRGIGGFHLACDATDEQAVMRLRERKLRYGKPFALMARDLDVVRRFVSLNDEEERLLSSPEAPIVLVDALRSRAAKSLPEAIAPGMSTVGFMLAYTPMHHLLLRDVDHPIVMTSGNLVDEPQATSIQDAKAKLATIADYAIFHDRDIANRIDDSVVRVMGGVPCVLRRARGYAPDAIALPDGFENAPDLLAYGGELKSTFCLVKNGAAILSQHQGDLENADTFDDYQKNMALYQRLYDHAPELLAADMHPEYLSTKSAKDRSLREGLPLVEIQHHHAHIASCMAENGIALGESAVLGVALDGLGLGDDRSIWGGEFLLADYLSYERVGTLKPVAMLGGSQAIKEPWRNTYAHIVSSMGWQKFAADYNALELYTSLQDKPRNTLDQMLAKGLNAPLASSCGRLFDAVAAAVGLARETAQFEGQGAMLLEAAVDQNALVNESDDLTYAFAITSHEATGLPYVDPNTMWQALFDDLVLGTPVPVIAARFHKGLAMAIASMVGTLHGICERKGNPFSAVALSGGCLQNKVLLEEIGARLSTNGYVVLTQSRVPANDGGLALGQAAIAAARRIRRFDASGG